MATASIVSAMDMCNKFTKLFFIADGRAIREPVVTVVGVIRGPGRQTHRPDENVVVFKV